MSKSSSTCPPSSSVGEVFVFVKFYFTIIFIYLFIFGCVGSSLLRAGLSLVAASGGSSSLLCTGFSLRWLLLLQSMALGAQASVVAARGLSSCGSQALERRLSSCGAQAQLLRGMWDLPGPGLEPVSPALAGGFLTTAQPGKGPSVGEVLTHQAWVVNPGGLDSVQFFVPTVLSKLLSVNKYLALKFHSVHQFF